MIQWNVISFTEGQCSQHNAIKSTEESHLLRGCKSVKDANKKCHRGCVVVFAERSS